MKFSTLSTLALPILGAAAEEPQYQAQFQNVLGNLGSYVPSYIPLPSRHDEVEAARTKAEQSISVLSLTNWKDILYEPVLKKFQDSPADAPRLSSESPEEWWVLITGGNKSCLGTSSFLSDYMMREMPKLTLLSRTQAAATRSKRPSTRRPPSSPPFPRLRTWAT